MKSTNDIACFIAGLPGLMTPLEAVAALGLDDCWIGAGFLRNAVWDHLHGRPVAPVPGSDVDVVYYDPADARPPRDLAIERQLAAAHLAVPWSVHNQARMHAANGDSPYRDVADAIRCWPETAMAVAARLHNGRVEILAPHGVDDLLALIVRPTPAFARRIEAHRTRQKSKRWRERWPLLRDLDG
jgi:hypothetical protein